MRAIALLITFLPLFVETAPHNRSRVCSANRNSARHRLGHHQGNSTSNGTSTVSQVIIHFSDAVSSTSDPSESATASAFEGVPSSFSIRASLDGVAAVQIGGGPVTTVVVTTTSTVSSAIASASLDGAEALGISVGPGTTTVVTTTSTVTSTRLTSSKLVTISSFKVIEPSTTWTTVTPTVYTTVTPPVSVSSIAPPANTPVKSPPANIPSSAPAASTPGKPPPATTPIPPPSTTPVAAPPPAKTPATPPPATTPASAPDSAAALSERGNAVGIGWNAQSGTNIKSLTGEPGSKLSWYYNWDLPPSPNMAGLEFVPQVWGSGSVPGVKGSDAKWPSGTKYVLSFNEPDQLFLNGGCNIDAATAATLHQQWVKALGGSYSIGAPAVAWGGKPWLQNWKNACAGQCNYDFVPFHFYGTDPNALISYAQDMHTTFGKPLWLTEWACRDYPSKTICNQAQVEAFMKTAIDWFRGDGAGIVERWAWFGAFPDQASQGNANGVEQADGSANAVGTYYVSL